MPMPGAGANGARYSGRAPNMLTGPYGKDDPFRFRKWVVAWDDGRGAEYALCMALDDPLDCFVTGLADLELKAEEGYVGPWLFPVAMGDVSKRLWSRVSTTERRIKADPMFLETINEIFAAGGLGPFDFFDIKMMGNI